MGHFSRIHRLRGWGSYSINQSRSYVFSFKELAARLNGSGGPIAGRANVDPRGVGGAFAVHIVDVEVDPDTGKVHILRYTALQDAGKAVHPSYVEGQIQGGRRSGHRLGAE